MWSTLFPAKIVKLNPPKKALKRATSTRLIKKQRFFSPAHLRFFLQNLLPNMRPVRITKRYAKPSTRTQQWKHAIAKTMLIMACGSYGSAYGLGANATDSTRYTFDIPSLKVEQALSQLARQTGHQLLFSYAMVDSHNSTAVVGEHSLSSALQQLLQNTPLTGNLTERGVILVTDTRALHNLEKGRGNMNITTKKSLLATFVAVFGAGAVSSGVMAQDGNDAAADQRQLDEIIVTAQKREQSLQEVPISITALSAGDLKAAGLTDLESIGYVVPSLVVSNRGSGSQRLTIRGVGSISNNSTSSLVGLYLDEVPVSAIPYAELDLRALDLARVEVLKGPQGTLYGQGSTGGNVRFITNNVDLSEVSGSSDISMYSTRNGAVGGDISGVINLPVVDGVFGLRIAAQYEDAGGWIDRPDVGQKDINDNELKHIRLKSLWLPTEDLSVNGMVVVHRNAAGGVNTSADENHDLFMVSFPTLDTNVEDNYELYNLEVAYNLESFMLLSSSSYISADKLSPEYTFSYPAASPTTLSETFLNSENEAEVFSQEIRLQSTVDSPVDWVAGVFYRKVDLNAIFTIDGAFGGVVNAPFIFPFDENSESWAIFGDVTYNLTSSLALGVGARYYEEDVEQVEFATQSATFDATTWRTTLSHKPSDEISNYINIATGFRGGTFNLSFLSGPNVEPEEVINYEIGTKINLMDNTLSFELALYRSEYDQIRTTSVQAFNGLALSVIGNGGKADIEGVDWAVKWYATEALKLSLNGNITKAEFVDTGLVSPSHLPGDKVDLIPDYSYSLSAEHQINWSSELSGSLRVDYAEQGKSFLTNRRSTGSIIGVIGESEKLRFLNMRLEAGKDDWTLALFAKNILDENGRSTPYERFNNNSRPKPRTIGFDVSMDF